MTLLPTLVAALVPLFALILLGYGLRQWAQVLHEHHVPVMNWVVMNVTLPATIFLAIAKAPTLPASYALLPALLILVEVVSFGVSYVMGRSLRQPAGTMGMLLLTGAFGNTAFLGYPVMLAIMPKLFPAGVLIDEFGMMILMYVAGAVIASRCQSGPNGNSGSSSMLYLVRFVRGAIFMAIVAGFVAHAARGHLPNWSHPYTFMGLQVTSYLGQATTPLVLLSLGAALRPKEAVSALLLIPCVVKLLVVPMTAWCLFRAFGMPKDLLAVCILQASMPTSVVVSVLCDRDGMDGARAGGVVCLTTVLSLITIPIMLLLLR